MMTQLRFEDRVDALKHLREHTARAKLFAFALGLMSLMIVISQILSVVKWFAVCLSPQCHSLSQRVGLPGILHCRFSVWC